MAFWAVAAIGGERAFRFPSALAFSPPTVRSQRRGAVLRNLCSNSTIVQLHAYLSHFCGVA